VQAYGSDRLRVSPEDGRIFLSSRMPKEWQGRAVRAASDIPHPGTAVLWDDVFYEVLEITELPTGGVQYELAPFPDDLLMRGGVAYDEASEVERAAVMRDVKRWERSRKIVNWLAPITGHAPAAVQEWMHREIGTPLTALTIASAIPPIIFAAVCLRWMLNERMDGAALPIPKILLLFALYLGIESAFRLYSAANSGRPVGSVPGLVVYAIAHALFLRHTALPSAFKVERGYASFSRTAPPDDVALHDALIMREPFLTLLAVRDQQKLAERFGFIGLLTSIGGLRQGHGLSALVSLFLSGWLAIEQVVRWPALASNGAASILRFVVRPLSGRLLD